MNKQSIFFTCIVGIVSTALMLLLLRRQIFKHPNNTPNEVKDSLSQSLWISSLLLTFFIFLKVALELVENAIEVIIYDSTVVHTFWLVMQKISIYIGFVFVFTWSLSVIVDWLLKMLYGKRDTMIELKNNHFSFFIMRGVLIVFLSLSLLPMFQHLLEWFAPVVNTPFYR